MVCCFSEPSVTPDSHRHTKLKADFYETMPHRLKCMSFCDAHEILFYSRLLSVGVQVYELASRNQSSDRNEVLSEWRKTGGVLVMGYQLFRILVSYSGKSKKTKQLYESSLIKPGK